MATEAVRYIDFDAAIHERDETPLVLRVAGEEFGIRPWYPASALRAVAEFNAATNDFAMARATEHIFERMLADPDDIERLWALIDSEQMDGRDLIQLVRAIHDEVVKVPLARPGGSPKSSSQNGHGSKADSSSNAGQAHEAAGS